MTWHDAVETGTKDWRRICDPEFEREFLLAAMDEGVAVQTALGKVLRAMGVKEFGERAGMAGPNVLRAIHPRHNPTQATLNWLLKPFKLRLSLARLEGPEGTHSEKTSSTVVGRQQIPGSLDSGSVLAGNRSNLVRRVADQEGSHQNNNPPAISPRLKDG